MNNNTNKQPNNEIEKIAIYVDADDTIMKSSEAVIKILNKKYNITPPKTIKDLRDWRYRSIYGLLGNDEVDNIFDSDEFFDVVELDNEFLSFYKANQKDFSFIVVTKGTKDNLKKKEEYLKKILGDSFEFIGIETKRQQYDEYYDKELGFKRRKIDKSSVNMRHGIQIDDRTDNLITTNAPVKILYKHDSDMYWNRDYENVNNLYAVNTWKEIIDILSFARDNHCLFKK